ncbi:Putative ACT-domain containing protein kinase family protein [Zea mays]|jgi:hypothetical protein|uniref:Putative ACT-domain containing protein kinase family protein n=1 Tax=Zea mays TaxID=4577 RepID=K7UBQ4_MAIZE|nr:Putative ACT-domain containing protein kinase family protein [Zea mays]
MSEARLPPLPQPRRGGPSPRTPSLPATHPTPRRLPLLRPERPRLVQQPPRPHGRACSSRRELALVWSGIPCEPPSRGSTTQPRTWSPSSTARSWPRSGARAPLRPADKPPLPPLAAARIESSLFDASSLPSPTSSPTTVMTRLL